MIKIGDITIDTKKDLNPEEAQRVKAFLVTERERKKQRNDFYANKYPDLEITNEEDLSMLYGDMGINSYEDLDAYYENLNEIDANTEDKESENSSTTEDRKIWVCLKRDFPSEQQKQERGIEDIEDDSADDNNIQKRSTMSNSNFINPTKASVTFFALAYLVIIIFTPVNIPKLGIRFVPFYTIGERIEEYYSEGVGYIPSYVRELNVQVLIIELLIATIVFAWSLYFFKWGNKKKPSVARGNVNRWRRTWDDLGDTIIHAVVLFVVILGLIWIYPPSEYPIEYSDKLRNVESSFIESVGYAWYDSVLVVKFKNNDNIYAYYSVPRSEYKRMINAESIGKYFNENIKNNYMSRYELN